MGTKKGKTDAKRLACVTPVQCMYTTKNGGVKC